MSDLLITLLKISGIFFLVGIIFVIISLLITNTHKRKQKRCLESTKGKVIDIVKRYSKSDADSRISYTLHPVFEYTIEGETIKKQSIFGLNKCNFSIGQDVEVHYNPLNHNDYYIVEEEATYKTIGKIFILLGISFTFLGIILFILAMLI